MFGQIINMSHCSCEVMPTLYVRCLCLPIDFSQVAKIQKHRASWPFSLNTVFPHDDESESNLTFRMAPTAPYCLSFKSIFFETISDADADFFE